MDITSRTRRDITVLEIRGHFDAHEAITVVEWLKEFTQHPPARLVVNLENVSFMDSSALATLVQGMKRCRQQMGDLYLCCLQQRVRFIFELTRLDKAFRTFASEDEAIQAFATVS